jgi:hypothetical protein
MSGLTAFSEGADSISKGGQAPLFELGHLINAWPAVALADH